VDFYCVVFFQLFRTYTYSGCSCCGFYDFGLPVLPVLSLLFTLPKASSWHCVWKYVMVMIKKLTCVLGEILNMCSVFRFYMQQSPTEK
jgi:hypothetical protein